MMLNSIVQLKRAAVRTFNKDGGGYPLIILNYHRVLEQADPFAIDAVTVKDFESQLQVLSNFYHILPLQQAVQALQQGDLPANAVCLTFDDGYRDNYSCAFELLKKYRAPATIFLATDFIDGREMLWHDRVLHAFQHADIPYFSWPDMQLDDISMLDDKERRTAAFIFLEGLKRFAPQERDHRIELLIERLEVNGNASERLMLSWAEILEMHRAGISFGAHTMSHPILATLDDGSLEREIAGSIETIAGRLGEPVRTFAYPNGRPGDFDDRAKALLQAAGIRAAVTTSYGINSASQAMYDLLRMAPWEVNPHRFAGRLYVEQILN